jgi:signal transduction histidine kinase
MVAILEILRTSPGLRRWAAFLLLVLVGWFDYVTGPEIAVAPFYILVLVGIGFLEPWGICLAYSGLAALVYLMADLFWDPTRAPLVFPYWRAVARLFSFSLISSTVSLLVSERKRLQLSQRTLEERGAELTEKNRSLEEALRELKRLQGDLVAKERQAAVFETVSSAMYEIEKPLVSISIYIEQLLQEISKDEGFYPVLDKIGERVKDMEEILVHIKHVRRKEQKELPPFLASSDS